MSEISAIEGYGLGLTFSIGIPLTVFFVVIQDYLTSWRFGSTFKSLLKLTLEVLREVLWVSFPPNVIVNPDFYRSFAFCWPLSGVFYLPVFWLSVLTSLVWDKGLFNITRSIFLCFGSLGSERNRCCLTGFWGKDEGWVRREKQQPTGTLSSVW